MRIRKQRMPSDEAEAMVAQGCVFCGATKQQIINETGEKVTRWYPVENTQTGETGLCCAGCYDDGLQELIDSFTLLLTNPGNVFTPGELSELRELRARAMEGNYSEAESLKNHSVIQRAQDRLELTHRGKDPALDAVMGWFQQALNQMKPPKPH